MNFTSISQQTFCYKGKYKDPQITTSTTLFCVFISILIVLAVFGNILVIIAISHFKVLQTPTNFLIMSLATSDLLVALTEMPFQILSKLCMEFNFTFCLVFVLCSYHVSFLSIYNVSLISLDRYLALTYPFKYLKMVTTKTTSVIIGTMWILSLGYNLFVLHLTSPCTQDTPNNLVWAYMDFLVVFIFPCSLIVILYMRIFTIVRKHAKSIEDSRGRHILKQSRDNTLKYSEQKAAKKLGVLVVVFIMCILPHYIFLQLSIIIPQKIIGQILDTTMTILQMNSVINPIIYALSYSWFRRSVKQILILRILNRNSSLCNVLKEAK